MDRERQISKDATWARIDALVDEIVRRHGEADPLLIVGIATGGVRLGKAIAARLGERLSGEVLYGTVSTVFHRDDIGRHPLTSGTIPTELDFNIDDSTVILVDDVVASGRTVRAAINELFDQGRPDRVELLAMADRGEARLPIVPDYTGFRFDVPQGMKVRLYLGEGDDDGIYFCDK